MSLISSVVNWFVIPGQEEVMMFGAMAATIFLLGALVIWLVPKYKWSLGAVLLAIITPLALGGFWFSDGKLGISDWDYYFSYHENVRRAVLDYGIFPQWNPYTCGGTSFIGDPEFPLFTLTFLLELIFGIPIGFKLAIYLATATGAIGMLFFSKQLRLSIYAGLIAAIAVAFSSVNILEIVEGHPNIFSAMWIPWIFGSWLMAYRDAKNIGLKNFLRPTKSTVLCSVFLALTFYAGGIYLLMYTAIALIGVIILSGRKRDALVITIQAGGIALGLAATKLFPVFYWLQQFQDTAYASSALTLPYLHQILLGRYLHGTQEIIPNQGGGWHEYGAYTGPILLLLSLIGIGYSLYARKRINIALTLSALLALLISSTGPLLKPLFDQAPFLPRSNISRFILFAIIPLALLAGHGFDAMRARMGKFKILALLLSGIIAVDLMTLSYALSTQAFVLPFPTSRIPAAPTPIAYSAFDYKIRHTDGADYTRAYASTLQGYGTLSYCSVLTPPKAVATIHDEQDNSILVIKNKEGEYGSYSLTSWTPNEARFAISAPSEATAVLNANYAKGWYVNGEIAREMGNRVGFFVPEGTEEIVFEYKAPGLSLGVIVTILTLLYLTYIEWRVRTLKRR